MDNREQLVLNLHKDVRQDPYIIELCRSCGIEMNTIGEVIEDIHANLFFDTMTWRADLLAQQMKIKFEPNLTQIEKNSIIEARWKSEGKCDVDLLQNICDSWENGEIDVGFIDGHIKIKFVNKFGVPTDLTSLKKAIEQAKSCHLVVDYLFKYILIKDIENMTIEQLEQQKIENFAF